jgi:predicted AAA+ superfamily ATPase
MYREKINDLILWKSSVSRKPLVLRGARQVGKTWLMQEFGKKYFKQALYINFEDSPVLQELFKNDFDINRIVKTLEIFTETKIKDKDTLIIFDEIQAVERGITSLKYFQEKANDLYVIAAGSLLGISMDSFPVGKVDFLDLYPMTFSEYLIAMGESELNELISDKDWLSLRLLREKLVQLLKTYYYVGGMPEALLHYTVYKDFDEVRKIQQRILLSYELDFAKHAPNTVLTRIRMVWQSIPAQLVKENKKFFYGLIRSGSRAKDFELAIQWLIDAGLVLKVNRIRKPELPIMAFEDFSAFKLFFHDLGLLSAKLGLNSLTLIDGNHLFLQYKGAFTEQFVAQQLMSNEDLIVKYWTNERSTSEVDFVIQKNENIIPIEVKAEVNVKAKSFKFFCEKYPGLKAYRLSMKDYKDEGWMENIPLYCIQII